MTRGRFGRRAAVWLAATVVLAAGLGCGSNGAAGARLRVVAAFYPLAWAAHQVAPDAGVEDLTPRGGEPHDLQLTARQRLDVQRASLVLILGKGFQPEVERAVRDTQGRVVDLLEGLPVLPSTEAGLKADPHVWLDPVLMRSIVGRIGAAIATVDPENRTAYAAGTAALEAKIAALDTSFRGALGACALKTLVTTHEAFGYLSKRYGLTQLGLTGLTPEAEPTAAQIQHVRSLARDGAVGAIFYEASDEGRRIGRSVASDVGVPALPLHTLESDPSPLDYLGQMQRNLAVLRQGLRCR